MPSNVLQIFMESSPHVTQSLDCEEEGDWVNIETKD